MAGFFELNKSSDGQFYFNLKAANGEVILVSELYRSKGSAEGGITAVRANCTRDDRYVKSESADGQFRFALRAANNEVIGNSETYTTAAARDRGIESVKANGTTSDIRDHT